MADAVYWQIIEAALARLKSMTFAVQQGDSCLPIAAAAIVFDKDPRSERHKVRRLPGIVLTLPKRVTMDPRAGLNVRDDVVYPLLAQIIDRDNHENNANIRTYLKWQEQIAKAFRHQPLPLENEAPGCVRTAFVTPVFTVDEDLWVRERFFVGGLELKFIAREPRGIDP